MQDTQSIDAGKLSKRVVILGPAGAQDASGGLLNTWTSLGTVWASIDIQTSSLIYETSAFVSKVIYRITMRWQKSLAISAANRVQYTDPQTGIVHTYTIEAPLNTRAENRELVLLCHELGGTE